MAHASLITEIVGLAECEARVSGSRLARRRKVEHPAGLLHGGLLVACEADRGSILPTDVFRG
jgi:hypothetical protein